LWFLTSPRREHYSFVSDSMNRRLQIHSYRLNKGIAMRTHLYVILFIGSLALSLTAYAEMYKFIDAQGQERWTDDLSQVPEAQRASVERIESVQETPAAAADGQAAEKTQDALPGTDAVTSESDRTNQTPEMDRQSLEMEKADLDRQYQELIEEREQLERIKAESENAGNQPELNQSILEYNRKTEAYESQLKAFNEKVKAYNQKIVDNQSKTSE